jgi:beta-N-acetylhexosaminidase
MSATKELALGPLMLDIEGFTLSNADRRRLTHPLTGGIILFTRNYESPEQLTRLTAEIHALRSPSLLIAVDHEGGRVQRFREGFTPIPPMREFGLLWEKNSSHARDLAREAGFVIASELRAHGVDLTFAPVLDIDHGNSSVIGDRAFDSNAETVAELARALSDGLHQGGMTSVGKHFPGHGHVRADSHHDVPIDERSYAEIRECDLVPFARTIGLGLGAVMPAHVIYPDVDNQPAGFSSVWLKDILRKQLRFDGVIFSDDLSMEGACVAGGIVDRARAAVEAGCDMVLVCNNPQAADELLSDFKYTISPVSLARLARMHGRANASTVAKLREDAHYAHAVRAIGGIGKRSGELPFT